MTHLLTVDELALLRKQQKTRFQQHPKISERLFQSVEAQH